MNENKEHRDRASGWKHAKLSGHSNESLVKQRLDEDKDYLSQLLKRMGYENEEVISTSIGGLHETNVPGVLGKKTKSKTDLKMICKSGKHINVSIKKSLSGQVYFVRAQLFIDVFEKQFGRKIPDDVQKAIKLFWAADTDNAVNIINQYGDKSDQDNLDLQLHHKSVNATTLKNYNESLYNTLLQWFQDNTHDLAKLCFTMGAAKDRSEWSEFVWYINLLGENNTDKVFKIDDICDAVIKNAKAETFYSTTNGGTTIQLPFGFVQWHQGQMQFHHMFSKLSKLLKGN